MDSSITLHVVCNPIVNFSVVQSLSSPIGSVIIENHSDKTLENLELVADSATDLMVDSTFPCAGDSCTRNGRGRLPFHGGGYSQAFADHRARAGWY